ncbi:HAD family hydrolase, partial [Acinetobacter baumannii]
MLETLGAITLVAFDKTGTLTEGNPAVTDIVGFDRPENEVLALAAALEVGSSHPLGKAILARAAANGVRLSPATAAQALSGKG